MRGNGIQSLITFLFEWDSTFQGMWDATTVSSQVRETLFWRQIKSFPALSEEFNRYRKIRKYERDYAAVRTYEYLRECCDDYISRTAHELSLIHI